MEKAKTTFDDNDFNATIVLNQYKSIVNHPKMMNQESALIFNLGVHYTSLNFTTFQKLINDILAVLTMVKELTTNGTSWNWKPIVIWKTSTAMLRERIPLKYLYLDCIRFQTNQVSILCVQILLLQLNSCQMFY